LFIEALRRAGAGIAPIFPQQSIREMTRTQRSPAEVLDAAVFGALQCGHLSGFGADADHLKTLDDVDRCADAGFVSFTLDAIEKVIDTAPRMNDADLLELLYRYAPDEAELRKILVTNPAKLFGFDN
jgi:hypothetical protein